MSDFLTMVPFVTLILLLLATVLMPLFVISINGQVVKIRKTLEAMEHMMRHGK